MSPRSWISRQQYFELFWISFVKCWSSRRFLGFMDFGVQSRNRFHLSYKKWALLVVSIDFKLAFRGALTFYTLRWRFLELIFEGVHGITPTIPYFWDLGVISKKGTVPFLVKKLLMRSKLETSQKINTKFHWYKSLNFCASRVNSNKSRVPFASGITKIDCCTVWIPTDSCLDSLKCLSIN